MRELERPSSVRILFTFVGSRGHFDPLEPIARAAETAGHVVAFACGHSMAHEVRAAGFTVFEMGPQPPDSSAPTTRAPLLSLNSRREERGLRERFVRRAGRERVPATLALCEEWRPDVLVCDETDFGAVVAAERRGVPYATVLVIAAGGFLRPDVISGALDELRAEHGLPPDPELAAHRRHLVLAPFPESYRDPMDPLPPSAHAYRPPSDNAGPGPAPGWSRALPGAPRVYFTLGTVFNMESGDLLERVLAGLRVLPINVLVTVGRDIDPAILGEQPANVCIERYVPQVEVLPHCDLVVSHGGSGAVIGALAHGLPMLLLPIGADQPLNAARCAALGVARVLRAGDLTSEQARDAVRAMLDEPSFALRAAELREEIRSLPDVSSAVDRLERLVG